MPKPQAFERSYRDTSPMVGVSTAVRSNYTPMERSAGKMSMCCDNCGIGYETQACWASRTNHHFCSRGCHDEFRRIRVLRACVICGAQWETNPTKYFRTTTCSRKCSSVRRKAAAAKYYEEGGAERLWGKTLHQWADALGIAYVSFCSRVARYRRGEMTVQRLLMIGDGRKQ